METLVSIFWWFVSIGLHYWQPYQLIVLMPLATKWEEQEEKKGTRNWAAKRFWDISKKKVFCGMIVLLYTEAYFSCLVCLNANFSRITLKIQARLFPSTTFFFFLEVSFSRPIVLFIHLSVCIIGFSPMTAYPCMTLMFLIKEQCWLSQVAWPRFCRPAITISLVQETSEFPVWGGGERTMSRRSSR